MRILIAGANGFIGNALCQALTAAGHCILRGVRRPGTDDEVAIDFTRPAPAAWQQALRGCDAAINAVGILREQGGQTFAALHTRGPQEFFKACAAAEVRRVVQISAQGAALGDVPFLASKRAADDFLRGTALEWQIVRPALVYGEAGASARLFRLLASLPLLPLPQGGRQRVHSLHIDDLCAEVRRLLDPATPAGQCLDLRGTKALSLRELVAAYRRSMGFPPALVLPLPGWLMGLAARAGEHLPGSLLDTQSWRMLQNSDTCVAPPFPPEARRPERFIDADAAPALRQAALASWRAPLLRLALAAVWLITAWVSLFAWPIVDSLALLARTGLTGTPALLALIGAALLDAALGLATLFAPGRRLWLAQMTLIAGYSAVIAIYLPEFLVHPYGPLSKNLPILAVLILLFAEEEKP